MLAPRTGHTPNRWRSLCEEEISNYSMNSKINIELIENPINNSKFRNMLIYIFYSKALKEEDLMRRTIIQSACLF